MAIKITDECIFCAACESECPNNAIYEGGVEWAIADGTKVKGDFVLKDGSIIDASQRNAPCLTICIISFQINVQSVRDFMRNPDVQLHVR